MSYQREREIFISRVSAEATCDPPFCYGYVEQILRSATVLQRHAEAECNRDVTEREQRRAEGAERRLAEAVEGLGLLGYRIDGDPRGKVVKVLLPSGAYNTWGGAEAGWAVPTR